MIDPWMTARHAGMMGWREALHCVSRDLPWHGDAGNRRRGCTAEVVVIGRVLPGQGVVHASQQPYPRHRAEGFRDHESDDDDERRRQGAWKAETNRPSLTGVAWQRVEEEWRLCGALDGNG